MTENTLLVYLKSRTVRPLWQWIFTVSTLLMTVVPLVVIAFLTENDRVIVAGFTAYAGFAALLFPLGMAFVGAMVSSTLQRKVGSLDLIRLTPLTDDKIMYALVSTTFYRVRILIILLASAILILLALHPLSDASLAYWLGYVFCVGLMTLNPITALIGIGVGLRISNLQVAPVVASGISFGLMVIWALIFGVAMERAYDAVHYQTENMSILPYAICVMPVPPMLAGLYQLGLRFIRDAV
ncbi:MAG: hypothetical protein K8L91_03410 [Anaerolineae bacterium]|nr:hypothetical protein [Anaerolineae bacterium]